MKHLLLPFIYFAHILRCTSLLLLPGILLLLPTQVQGSHIRAGDLTIQRLPDGGVLRYRVLVVLYRDTRGVPAGEGLIEFGTGDPGVIVSPRSLGFINEGTTEVIQYETIYTFPGPGSYRISYFERNRNAGVNNMFASDETPFYIESEFLISPFLGLNSSPVLTIPPIDQACAGQRFIHNPGAFDAQGDSISYRMTIPRRSRGENVIQYSSPADQRWSRFTEAGTTPPQFSINPVTGDLIWDAPLTPGEYNVAFFVDEWRDGILIGSVNRDMQIIVRDCRNIRPSVIVPRDTCIVAGAALLDTIRATDPDRHRVQLTVAHLSSTIFNLEPPRFRATFDTLGLQPPNGLEKGIFNWQTTCLDVRREPYQATFKAEDFPTPLLTRLADLQTWRIRVIGPKPDTLIASLDPVNATVQLNWLSYSCPNAARMTVWRRQGSFDFNPTCETGLPGYTGYQQIGEVPIGTTSFLDNNNGRGLERGSTYCYRIFAVFPDPAGGESLASMEVCVFVPSNAPYITNVSVEETSLTNGSIFVRWTRPIDLDTTVFPRPLTYNLARAEGFTGTTAYTPIGGTFAEADTFFTDINLNTNEKVYNYRVLLYSQGVLIDSSRVASSVRLGATPEVGAIRLNWQAQVPWNNQSATFPWHYIYRQEDRGSPFVLIDSVNVSGGRPMQYVDDGRLLNEGFLSDENLYCYKILTQGTYGNPNINAPLLNFSQIACSSIADTTAPCPPLAIALRPADLNCDVPPAGSLPCRTENFTNLISWELDTDPECGDDTAFFKIYFSRRQTDSLALYTLLASVPADQNLFAHTQLNSVAGCYIVTAIDARGNESPPINKICNDNCPYYELPNVFTPNGDGINDVFTPFPCPRFVSSVKFTVFNRWGELVYNSENDIMLNWTGVNNSGRLLSSGLYYYIAEITYIRLEEAQEQETVRGWIRLLRE